MKNLKNFNESRHSGSNNFSMRVIDILINEYGMNEHNKGTKMGMDLLKEWIDMHLSDIEDAGNIYHLSNGGEHFEEACDFLGIDPADIVQIMSIVQIGEDDEFFGI